MTAYSAAKLLFGDYRQAETTHFIVRDPKTKGVGQSSVGFTVLERCKKARNTLFFFIASTKTIQDVLCEFLVE